MPLENVESSRRRPHDRLALHPPRVYVSGLGTAVPPFSADQNELLQFVLSHFTIKESTQALYQKTFADPSISKRHFAVDRLTDVLERDHDRINARFKEWAVRLSTESLSQALASAGLSPRSLDFLIVTTCTGYLCPGLSSYLVESCGLKSDIALCDAVGMGCGAALPALQQAANFTRANPGSSAAVVGTEICSAALFSNDAPDIVISNTLFSDGSAAAILNSGAAGTSNRFPAIHSFASLTVPEWRDTLRFRNENGYLRNVLAKEVPEQAGRLIKKILHRLLVEAGLSIGDVRHWILHPGGKKILDSIESSLGLPPDALCAPREILKNFGNMSSPSVFFAWQEEHRARPPAPGDWGVLCSFGAGFSAHAALLHY